MDNDDLMKYSIAGLVGIAATLLFIAAISDSHQRGEISGRRSIEEEAVRLGFATHGKSGFEWKISAEK